MKQLQWLQANSYNVSIECNRHRGYCKSTADEIEESPETYSDLSAEQKAELIAKDQICIVQLYPDTSVGFLLFIGPDATECVERAYLWLWGERGSPAEEKQLDTETIRACASALGASGDYYIEQSENWLLQHFDLWAPPASVKAE